MPISTETRTQDTETHNEGRSNLEVGLRTLEPINQDVGKMKSVLMGIIGLCHLELQALAKDSASFTPGKSE